MKRILIVAGGTGGHIFPALAVAEELKNRGVEVHWLGSFGGMETKIIKGRFPLHLITMGGIRGKGIRTWLLAPWRLLRAILQAGKILSQIKPDVVLGMGGFVSGPGGLAAWLWRYPLVIHEQNSKAGYANRLLARLAQEILSGFPQAFASSVKSKVVGNPIRQEIIKLQNPLERFKNRQDHSLRILILGGSRGARALNQLMLDGMKSFDAEKQSLLSIWHQTGDTDDKPLVAAYQHTAHHKVEKFIHNMSEAYSWADLIICRAGASTVSEIAAVGLAAILIPYPYAVDNHQYYNGLYLERAGAAFLMPEKNLTVDKLNQLLTELMAERGKLITMAENARKIAFPHATKTVADILMRY